MADGRSAADKFERLALKRAEYAFRSAILMAGADIIMATPVGNPSLWKSPAPKGYVGGQHRGAWQFGINRRPEGQGTVDSGGEATIAAVEAAAKAIRPADVGYLTNRAPAIRRLEYEAHSSQAPDGMVRITARRWDKEIFPAAVKAAINQVR